MKVTYTYQNGAFDYEVKGKPVDKRGKGEIIQTDWQGHGLSANQLAKLLKKLGFEVSKSRAVTTSSYYITSTNQAGFEINVRLSNHTKPRQQAWVGVNEIGLVEVSLDKWSLEADIICQDAFNKLVELIKAL